MDQMTMPEGMREVDTGLYELTRRDGSTLTLDSEEVERVGTLHRALCVEDAVRAHLSVIGHGRGHEPDNNLQRIIRKNAGMLSHLTQEQVEDLVDACADSYLEPAEDQTLVAALEDGFLWFIQHEEHKAYMRELAGIADVLGVDADELLGELLDSDVVLLIGVRPIPAKVYQEAQRIAQEMVGTDMNPSLAETSREVAGSEKGCERGEVTRGESR